MASADISSVGAVIPTPTIEVEDKTDALISSVVAPVTVKQEKVVGEETETPGLEKADEVAFKVSEEEKKEGNQEEKDMSLSEIMKIPVIHWEHRVQFLVFWHLLCVILSK